MVDMTRFMVPFPHHVKYKCEKIFERTKNEIKY
jgi:hypothetical protein